MTLTYIVTGVHMFFSLKMINNCDIDINTKDLDYSVQ